MPSAPQHSFSGGEWSPYVSERVDLSKYSVSCETLENAILSVYGTARSRPGTEFIAAAKYADRECRLIKFQFSETTTFILEVGDLYMRFYSNGVAVETGGVVYEIASPYTAAQLRDVQYSQINDEMRLVHPDHPPYILRRLSDISWTLAEIRYTEPALRDENLDETMTITPSDVWGTGITLTAAGHTFNEKVVGSYYRVGHTRTTGYVKTPISTIGSVESSVTSCGAGVAGTRTCRDDTGTERLPVQAFQTGKSSVLRVRGDWEVFTSGTWDATLVLERRKNEGEWKTIRSWDGEDDRNITATGTELEDDVEMRVRVTRFKKSPNVVVGSARILLEVVSAEVYGMVKITAVADGGVTATADVITPFDSTEPTFLWSEGAWNPVRGYPRTITLHEARMVYGGNLAQAQTLWLSDIDGYDRFSEADLEDSDSFRVTLGGTEFNMIQWLSTSPKNLLIGTVAGEWSLSSGDEQNLLTGSSARASEESSAGSEHIQAVSANDVVLFVNKGGRDLTEIVYSFEQDGFINANLTELGEHVTKGGIKEMAFQKSRDSILWCITGSGTLAGLTYVRKQEVVGWHRHITQGAFESVAVISSNLEEEEVWFSVQRTINGATTRYIERFYPDMWRIQEETVGAPVDLVYVDAATVATGTALTTVSIPHLENELVHVLEDGATTPPQTAGPTSITTVEPSSKVIVGLPFSCKIRPLPIELKLEDGTSQGREKRIHEVIVSVYQTSTFKMGPTEARLDTVFARSTEDPMDLAPALVTEKISKPHPSLWQTNAAPLIVQDQPLPLTVLGIVRNFTVKGDA